MAGRAWRRLGGVLLVVVVLAGGARPQDESAAPTSVESADDLAYVKELAVAFRRGGSHTAVRELREYLEEFPASPTAQALAAEVALGRGELDLAAEHLDAGGDPAPRLRARLWMRTGRYEEALELGRSGRIAEPGASVVVTEALDALGRRREALAFAREVTDRTDDRALDGHGLLDLGRLLMFQRRYELASQALVFADAELNGRQGPSYHLREPEVLVALGRVYGLTRQSGRGGPDPALAMLNEVLDVDAGHPEALVVKAMVYDYGMAGGKAREALAQALTRDPGYPEALFWRGRLALAARRADAALEAADAILAVDPRQREGLALRATALAVSGSDDAAEARAAFERLHPESAELDQLLGLVLQQHYRFEDSIPPLERALQTEPDDESPLPVLAQSLAHVGREQEARAALEEHRRRSPFDYPWRENMLKVLARLAEDVEVADPGRLRLRLPPGEQDVLGVLLLQRLSAAREEMSRRWAVDLDDEVLVEVFDRHADFSVRTVGFSGFLALGACFGDVFTMLSPLSEMRGQFHWAQTAVHEFAHVITLELSRQRVPRWLTEGISVVEEKRVDPSWARELERDVLDARANGRLLPVERLDEAFRDGSTVMLGYFEGSLVAEVIERDFGFDKLRDLVAAFADDRTTGEAVRFALGIEPAELDARLERYVEEDVAGRARLRPRYGEDGKDRLRRRVADGDLEALLPLAQAYHDLGRVADRDAVLKRQLDEFGETPATLRLLAERDLQDGRAERALERLEAWRRDGTPDSDGLVMIARLLLAQGDRPAAIERLWEAHALFPGDLSPHGPAAMLRTLLDPDDDAADWERIAADIVAHDETALELRLVLARRWQRAGCDEDALRLLEQAADIDPYRPDVRLELAEHRLAAGDVDGALEQWRLVLAMRADQAPASLHDLVVGVGGAPGTSTGAETDLATLQEHARARIAEHAPPGD